MASNLIANYTQKMPNCYDVNTSSAQAVNIPIQQSLTSNPTLERIPASDSISLSTNKKMSTEKKAGIGVAIAGGIVIALGVFGIAFHKSIGKIFGNAADDVAKKGKELLNRKFDESLVEPIKKEIQELEAQVKSKTNEFIKKDIYKALTSDGSDIALSANPLEAYNTKVTKSLDFRTKCRNEIKTYLKELIDIPKAKELRTIRKKIEKDPRNITGEYYNDHLSDVSDFIYTTIAYHHPKYSDPRAFKQIYGMSVEEATEFIIKNQDKTAKDFRKAITDHFKYYNANVSEPYLKNPKGTDPFPPLPIKHFPRKVKNNFDVKINNDNNAVIRAKMQSFLSDEHKQNHLFDYASKSKEETIAPLKENFELYNEYISVELPKKLAEFEPYKKLQEKKHELSTLLNS